MNKLIKLQENILKQNKLLKMLKLKFIDNLEPKQEIILKKDTWIIIKGK